MATSAKVFSFVKDTTTGAHQQVITGLGFQPKGVIFFSNMQTASGIQADANFMIGISDGTNHKCVAMSDDDTQATTVSSSTLNSTNCIVILQNGSTTIDSAGDIDSFDSDGLTIGWNSASATQFIINGIAFGGSDVTNVKVMKHDCISNASAQAYTGVGFQPNIVFFLWGRTGVAEANTAGTGCNIGWGAAKSSSEIAYCAGVVEAAQATSDTYHKYSNAEPINIMTNSGGTLDYTTTGFTSMDSNGFTLANAGNSNTSTDFFTMSIKGGTWDVGAFQQKSGTGTQNITVDTGCDPTVLLLSGVNSTTIDGPTGVMSAQCRISMGASDGTNEHSIFCGSTDAQATAEIAKSAYSNTKVLQQITEGAGSSTTNAECDFTAHQDGQFTLDWTTADTTLRRCWFIALEADTAPAMTTVSQTSIHKYNLLAILAQTSIHKYNLRHFITQSSINKYNLRAFVAVLTSIQKYNLRHNVAQTTIQKYNLRKYLSQTSIHKYTLRNFVAITTTIQKYNLRHNIAQTIIHKYNMRAMIAQTSIHKYRMAGVVLATIIAKYNLRRFISQTTIQKYNLRLTVAATTSIQKYNLRRFIPQTTIQKYNLRAYIFQTSIHKYNLRKFLAQTSIQKYTLRVTVAVTNTIQKYNLRRFVPQTIIHKYNMRAQVLQTSTQKYNLGPSLPIDMTQTNTKTYSNKFIVKT